MTMTTLAQLLYFDGADLRMGGDFFTPLFVAHDVCKILGIANVSDAVASLDDYQKDAIVVPDSIGRNQELIAVTEHGLYALAFRSRKASAKSFQKWVCDVIKELRTKGTVSLAPQEQENILATQIADLRDDVDAIKALVMGCDSITAPSVQRQQPLATPTHLEMPLSEPLPQPKQPPVMSQALFDEVQAASARGLTDSTIVKDVLRMGGPNYQNGKAFLLSLREAFKPLPEQPEQGSKRNVVRVEVVGSNAAHLKQFAKLNNLTSTTAAANLALSRILPQLVIEASHR